MRGNRSIYADWNPWHGCTKLSAGCKFCYVYRQDAMYGCDVASNVARKTANFDLPIQRKSNRSYKIPSGKIVFTCFTSDFLLQDADCWRHDCWTMMRRRSDCIFYFFTKRIDRFMACIPDDWGDGYDNVFVGCTIENQAMADYRLPIFNTLPIKRKTIIVAPMLERIDIEPYLNPAIAEVAVSGESGIGARICDFDWILDLRRQCMAADIPFCFHQTGARLRKNGRVYYIGRQYQISQAQKAGIDYKTDYYTKNPTDRFFSLDL